MAKKPILKEHKKLLTLIAKGMATKSWGDGYSHDHWINYTHSNLVKEMKANGWPPLINLAIELVEHGLIEFQDPSRPRIATITHAGQEYLNGNTPKVRQQVFPPLTISHLHSEVQRISGHLVADGHYRQAITDTFIGLDNYVASKSGIADNGNSLMQKVFSANNPILKLSKNVEEQAGFMMLFAGAMKAIRNQYAHNLINPNSSDEALEWLGFASALFRLVDSSQRSGEI